MKSQRDFERKSFAARVLDLGFRASIVSPWPRSSSLTSNGTIERQLGTCEAPDLADARRWITIGYSALQRVLFVVHTEALRGGRTRIISARKASSGQRRKYEEG